MMTTTQSKAIEAMVAAFGSREAAMTALAAYGQTAATVALPASDAAFAALVVETARNCQTGRASDRKVFISHVLAAMGVSAEQTASAKARLVQCQADGLLSLSRCDVVEGYEAADVDGSETARGRATFHFVRI